MQRVVSTPGHPHFGHPIRLQEPANVSTPGNPQRDPHPLKRWPTRCDRMVSTPGNPQRDLHAAKRLTPSAVTSFNTGDPSEGSPTRRKAVAEYGSIYEFQHRGSLRGIPT